jgi:hypothetical protein
MDATHKMDSVRDNLATDGRQLLLDADRLLIAMEALAATDAPEAEYAEKYALRIRFALTRLAQLERDVERAGGVFAPARVEVATSILETHTATAAEYVNRALRRVRRTAKRRSVHVAVAEACALAETRLSEAA